MSESYEDELREVEANALQLAAKTQAMEVMFAYRRGPEALEAKIRELASRDETYVVYGLIYLVDNLIESLAEIVGESSEDVMAEILTMLTR